MLWVNIIVVVLLKRLYGVREIWKNFLKKSYVYIYGGLATLLKSELHQRHFWTTMTVWKYRSKVFCSDINSVVTSRESCNKNFVTTKSGCRSI